MISSDVILHYIFLDDIFLYIRHDMIACLGETTGTQTLQNILNVMKNSPEGNQILSDRPRINSNVIDLDALGKLPADTFGYAYRKFLDDNVSMIVFVGIISQTCLI